MKLSSLSILKLLFINLAVRTFKVLTDEILDNNKAQLTHITKG